MNDFRINRGQPVNPYASYLNQSRPSDQPARTAGKNDKVEISSEARRMSGTQKLEEARNEKIERIRQQISSGTYHVKSEDVAAKLYAYWNRR